MHIIHSDLNNSSALCGVGIKSDTRSVSLFIIFRFVLYITRHSVQVLFELYKNKPKPQISRAWWMVDGKLDIKLAEITVLSWACHSQRQRSPSLVEIYCKWARCFQWCWGWPERTCALVPKSQWVQHHRRCWKSFPEKVNKLIFHLFNVVHVFAFTVSKFCCKYVTFAILFLSNIAASGL